MPRTEIKIRWSHRILSGGTFRRLLYSISEIFNVDIRDFQYQIRAFLPIIASLAKLSEKHISMIQFLYIGMQCFVKKRGSKIIISVQKNISEFLENRLHKTNFSAIIIITKTWHRHPAPVDDTVKEGTKCHHTVICVDARPRRTTRLSCGTL